MAQANKTIARNVAAKGSPDKAKLAKTVTDKPQRAKRVAAIVDPVQMKLNAFLAAQEALLAEVGAPTWKRKLAAFVTTVVIAVGIGWLLGQILAALFVGILMLTGSAFIAWALWAIGLIVGSFFGGKLAAKCGIAVLTHEADDRAHAFYAGAKRKLLAPARWIGSFAATA